MPRPNLWIVQDNASPIGQGRDNGGDGGDNGGMDGRLAHLEMRVDSIDGRLGRIEGDVASLKSDLSDVKVAIASLDAKLDIGSIRASVEKSHTDIYKWVASLAIGAIVLGLSVYFSIQRLQQPPLVQAPTQPTIIYTQPAPSAAAPTAQSPQQAAPPQN